MIYGQNVYPQIIGPPGYTLLCRPEQDSQPLPNQYQAQFQANSQISGTSQPLFYIVSPPPQFLMNLNQGVEVKKPKKKRVLKKNLTPTNFYNGKSYFISDRELSKELEKEKKKYNYTKWKESNKECIIPFDDKSQSALGYKSLRPPTPPVCFDLIGKGNLPTVTFEHS